MLRILVISLVVANLLLFGFQSSKPRAGPETPVVPAKTDDVNIPTIHLFNEMVEEQGLITGTRQCFSLGPFHSEENKEEVRERLLEVSVRINERQTEALVEQGYWVFLLPYDSLLEANRALFSLQALGLNDIEVIFEGKLQNGISLGYFLRQGNAEERKNGLEDRGYEPLMRVQRRVEPRYWFDYEQQTGSELITLNMQNRPNDFMQRRLPCPEQDFAGSSSRGLPERIEESVQFNLPEENAMNASDQDRGNEQGEISAGDSESTDGINQDKG